MAFYSCVHNAIYAHLWMETGLIGNRSRPMETPQDNDTSRLKSKGGHVIVVVSLSCDRVEQWGWYGCFLIDIPACPEFDPPPW
jgi:hypothetical protein